MPPANPKKRRDQSSNVIAETPTKAARRNDGVAETPHHSTSASNKRVNVAVIPPTGQDRPVVDQRAGRAAASITPQDRKKAATTSTSTRQLDNPQARRNIFPGEEPPPVTPSNAATTQAGKAYAVAKITPAKDEGKTKSPAKRRLLFGREVEEIALKENTKRVYKLVKKLTGSIGGNGSCGPIYGELTMGSMQKMVNLMQKYTGLDNTSRFIDVGSGIGKPNLHVTQDPAVAFSCGIEMELDRWRLGLKCLQLVLQQASKDEDDTSIPADEKTRHNCMFLHGNIMEARTFDPFTHVYMFSIGFPPKLWVFLSEAWNRSRSPYLICFHSPKTMIDDYNFDLELLAQIPTSMHGSKEGHTGYIYQRKGLKPNYVRAYIERSPCDKVFKESYQLVQAGLDTLREAVDKQVEDHWSFSRSMTRSVAREKGVILSKEPDSK